MLSIARAIAVCKRSGSGQKLLPSNIQMPRTEIVRWWSEKKKRRLQLGLEHYTSHPALGWAHARRGTVSREPCNDVATS